MTEVSTNEDAMLMTALPPGFQLVRVKEGEVELCPGILLAGASKIPHGVELPLGVVYCFRKKDAPLAKGIKRVPYHMGGLPEVKGCVPLLLPTTLQLVEGVRLILGAKLPLNTVLPPNVMIVQRDSVAIARGIIPKGMTEVQLSTVLKTPANFRLNSGSKKNNILDKLRPSSLMMVQMHTTVTLPVGCEVAPGCEIARNIDDMSLPHGVQLIRCTDECLSLPSFMTPLDVYSGFEASAPQSGPEIIDPAVLALASCRDELNLHKQMGHTSCIVSKPEGFAHGPGVEMILSHGPGQWMGDVSSIGMRPLMIDEYPVGLSSSDLLRYLPKATASPGNSEIENYSLTDSSASKTPVKGEVVQEQVLELVQLSPRFDFPDGATPFPGWQFFPRPFDMRLPLGVHLLQHSPDHFSSPTSAGQVPTFVHIVPIPERQSPPNFVGIGPIGGESSYVPTQLPAGLIACEFLPGVSRPLPEGATIAPGMRVLSPATVAAMIVRAQAPASSSFERRRKSLELQISKLLPINACLVSREQPVHLLEKSNTTEAPGDICLPVGVIRAGDTVLIPNLPPDIEVLLLAVRFEVPAGVRIAAGTILGSNTQLSPGTIINRDLCVVEWPREIMIPRPASCFSTPVMSEKSVDPYSVPGSAEVSPAGSRKSSTLPIPIMNVIPQIGLPRGQELVRILPSSYSLPLGIGQALPHLPSPTDSLIVTSTAPYRSALLTSIGGLVINLPTDGSLQTCSPQQLAEQIEVYSLSDVISRIEMQLEVERSAKPGLLDLEFTGSVRDALNALKVASLETDPTEPPLLPQGAVFIRRSGPSMQLPSSMVLVENSQLPFLLCSALTASAKCHDRAQIEKMTAVEKMLLLGPDGFKAARLTPIDLEVVQLAPKYALPAGTEIGPGVFVLSRPHWLVTPLWVEMVTMIPPAEPEFDGDEIDKELGRKREMLRRLRAVRLPPPLHPEWPLDANLILVPDDIEVYSFGKAAPGFEALVRSTARHTDSSQKADHAFSAIPPESVSISEKGGHKTTDTVKPSPSAISIPANALPSWLELMPLPSAHFLVQRSRIVPPPVGLKMGFGPSYEHLVNNFRLPPGAEVLRVCASFHLPLGITLHSTQILSPHSRVPAILPSSIALSSAQLHLHQQKEFLESCNSVYESVQITAGQEVFPGMRVIAQPLNCIDWLSHLQSSMAASANLLVSEATAQPPVSPSLALTHPSAFVRIIESSAQKNGALTSSTSLPVYTLPPGVTELENSSTIVSIAFDDPLTELSVSERNRGFKVSDVIKVVLLPSTLPLLRNILRQHGKTDIVKVVQKKPRSSIAVVLDKVVHPVIKITRSKPDSSGNNSSSDGFSRGGSENSSVIGGGGGSEGFSRRNSSGLVEGSGPAVMEMKKPKLTKTLSFGGHSNTARAHSLDCCAPAKEKVKRELASVIAARAAKEKIELIAFSKSDEKSKSRKEVAKRRVSFNGSVVHSAETAAIALSSTNDTGAYHSITANLPAAESLIISLAAAERVIRGLEKENNTYRERIRILTEVNETEMEKSVQYKGHIQRVETECSIMKKTAEKAKYGIIRDDRQVELRVRELTAMKVKYTELKSKTDPLIASMTTKLHYFENAADMDEQEKKDALAIQLRNIREEADVKHNEMITANQKIVGGMQEGYRSVLEDLCGGMGRLGFEIAAEAMMRQERAVGAFQRAVGQLTEISLLSTGHQQQEIDGFSLRREDRFSTSRRKTPFNTTSREMRASSAMNDSIRPLDDVSMMSDEERTPLPDPATAGTSSAGKSGKSHPVLTFSNAEPADRLPDFERSVSSKKELVRGKSSSRPRSHHHSYMSSSTPSSVAPEMYSFFAKPLSNRGTMDNRGLEDARSIGGTDPLYPSMYLDQGFGYEDMSLPSLGSHPLSDTEKQAAVHSWVDAEGLKRAVMHLFDTHNPANTSNLAIAAGVAGGKTSQPYNASDDALKDWVSRIASLHHMVSIQEEERYLRALSLGEREARLLLRRQRAAEHREDMAHRNLQRLLLLEAKVGNSRKARSARGRTDGETPVLFSESSLCTTASHPYGDTGGGGGSLSSGAMLFPNVHRTALESDESLSPFEGGRDRDSDCEVAAELGVGESEDDRKSLETISELKDCLHKTQTLLQQPTVLRLTGLSDSIRDLRDMETSLCLYGMALKKQVLALQQQLSSSGELVVSQSVDDENRSLPAYLSEVDRRALQHRMSCLQTQLSNIETRSSSLKKEIESERLSLVQELFTYESCIGEVSVPGLSRIMSDMRVWARTSEAAVNRNIGLENRPPPDSNQSRSFSPTTRSRKLRTSIQLDPLSSVSVSSDATEKRAGSLMNSSRSGTSKDMPVSMSHLNIGWRSNSSNDVDAKYRAESSTVSSKGIRGASGGGVGAAAGHRLTASLSKPLQGFDSRLLRDVGDRGRTRVDVMKNR